jgi:hypothetical protein
MCSFLALSAPAQDWQACKPEGDYSFNDVKAAVHRVTSSRMYSGWDEKMFSRSGDLVAVAVLKMSDDDEMASPEHVKDVLLILRSAFACPQYCVKVIDDRRPRMTLLLLEQRSDQAPTLLETRCFDSYRFVHAFEAQRCKPLG